MTLEFRAVSAELAFEPTHEAGLAALHTFLPQVPEYGRMHNFVVPGHPHVSRLGAYLSVGLLSESEVARTVLREHAYGSADRYLEQLGWRTYWRGWLAWHPGVWERYRRRVEEAVEALSDIEVEMLENAKTGNTGIAIFDDWTRELLETGYLRNHARMWWASIWIFTLRLPWELGADFFLRHLLDGDVAANTLSWRWVAGLHTRGKHYLARAANIAEYTQGRGEAAGMLNESAGALVETDLPERAPELPAVKASTGVDMPSLGESPAGLLVLPGNLVPEESVLTNAAFQSVAVIGARSGLPGVARSERVRRFQSGALRDATRRVARHWEGTVIDLDSLHGDSPEWKRRGFPDCRRIYAGEVDSVEKAVMRWARRERLRSIRVLEPAVGPWSDCLERLRGSLRREGIALCLYRDPWDAAHWPAATAGYFAFRKGWKSRLEATLGTPL